MKKLIVIFLIIVCSCGIGYLGYLIFKSKNIDTVELVGKVQTLYIVGDEIDYEDAQLKVTYKNGNIKMVDLDSKSVEVQYFSTSVEAHGKMNIIYKSEVLPIEYNVIQKGAYYLTEHNTKEYVSNNVTTSNQGYTIANTTEMFYLESGGVCRYYSRNAGNWYMNDGSYDTDYNYSIVADTLVVNFETKTYNIKAEYLESGKIQLVYSNLNAIEDTNLVTKEEYKTFEHTAEMKTNQTVSKAEINYDRLISGNEYVDFVKNETFESRNAEVYLKVTYKQYSSHQFQTVYVKVHESMIVENFDTSKAITSVALLSYNGIKNIGMGYVVK